MVITVFAILASPIKGKGPAHAIQGQTEEILFNVILTCCSVAGACSGMGPWYKGSLSIGQKALCSVAWLPGIHNTGHRENRLQRGGVEAQMRSS